MTANESFDALAHVMAMGTYLDSAERLIEEHEKPHAERDQPGKFLSDDDHTKAALLIVQEADSFKPELLFAGDDLPAHMAWVVEALLRLKVNDPSAYEATRDFWTNVIDGTTLT